jgi:hypothetical protein
MGRRRSQPPEQWEDLEQRISRVLDEEHRQRVQKVRFLAAEFRQEVATTSDLATLRQRCLRFADRLEQYLC